MQTHWVYLLVVVDVDLYKMIESILIVREIIQRKRVWMV